MRKTKIDWCGCTEDPTEKEKKWKRKTNGR
jgi:hypothetical protein